MGTKFKEESEKGSPEFSDRTWARIVAKNSDEKLAAHKRAAMFKREEYASHPRRRSSYTHPVLFGNLLSPSQKIIILVTKPSGKTLFRREGFVRSEIAPKVPKNTRQILYSVPGTKRPLRKRFVCESYIRYEADALFKWLEK